MNNDLHWQENALLGSYLGLSDIVKGCDKQRVAVPWDYIRKRLVELRIEHDKLHEGVKP
jgi:hypothetical protein